jgi:hypothetical protein
VFEDIVLIGVIFMPSPPIVLVHVIVGGVDAYTEDDDELINTTDKTKDNNIVTTAVFTA